MSALPDLIAARAQRQQDVEAALAGLTTAALTTRTTAAYDAALAQFQEAVKAFWDADHLAHGAARRGGFV